MEANLLEFPSSIEKHVLFSAGHGMRAGLKALKNDQRRDRDVNVATFHADLGLLVTDSEGLKVIPSSQIDTKNSKDDAFSVLKPTPWIPFEIHSLAINPSCTIVALQGRKKVAVLSLGSAVKADVQKLTPSVSVKSVTIGEAEKRPANIEALKVAWHPLSETHLLVLYSDRTLRMYNLSHNAAEAEQVFFLTSDKVRSSSVPISFSCGSSRVEGSFDSMTVFVLFNSGEVFALCPVLPFRALVPRALIASLSSPSTKLWLMEIKGGEDDDVQSPKKRKPSKSSVGVASTRKKPLKVQKNIKKASDGRKSKGKSKEKAPKKKGGFSMSALDSSSESDSDASSEYSDEEESDDLDEETNSESQSESDSESDSASSDKSLTSSMSLKSEHDKAIWTETKPPRGFAAETVALQGPLTLSNESKTVSGADIAVLPSVPPAIVTVRSDGIVDLFITIDPIEPRWATPNRLKAVDIGSQIAHIDRLDLQVPQLEEISQKAMFSVAPRLLKDDLRLSEIAVVHSAGLHLVKLPAITSLNNIANGSSNESVDALPPSTSHCLVSIDPLGGEVESEALQTKSTPIGRALIRLGNKVAVALLGTEGNLTAIRLGFDGVAKKAEAKEKSSSALVSKTVDLAESFPQPPPLQRIQSFPTGQGVFQSPAALEFFTKVIDNLNNTHLKYIYSVQSELALTERRLGKMIAEQNSAVTTALADFERVKAKQVELQAALTARIEAQAVLMQRVDNILGYLYRIRKPSRADSDFERELNDIDATIHQKYANQLRALEDAWKAEQSQKKVDASLLSAADISELKPQLSEQQESIEAIRKRIQSIQRSLDDLF